MEHHIKTPHHLAQWTSSPAYQRLVDFIERYNTVLIDKDPTESQVLTSLPALELGKMMQSVIESIDRFLPAPDSSTALRFGNPLFRDWYTEIENTLDERLAPWLELIWQAGLPRSTVETETFADMKQPLQAELKRYFLNSLGSPIRLDYGTGHELSFIAFLCLCEQVCCWTETEMPLVVTCLFGSCYLKLTRRLQCVYRLEPAGSHGAWGLDDYAFLSFIWGSAQLIGKEIEYPTDAINSLETVCRVPCCYLYFDAIHYIYQMKRGPLSAHSPILYDISGIPKWSKINAGLIKMYKAEVLGKLPVVQHFLFGKFLKWEAS